MIQVKEAVQNAVGFAQGVLDTRQTLELRLEEVELSSEGDKDFWLITLSMPDLNIFGMPAGNVRRYKIFKVDGDSGEVLAMKIRELAHAE